MFYKQNDFVIWLNCAANETEKLISKSYLEGEISSVGLFAYLVWAKPMKSEQRYLYEPTLTLSDEPLLLSRKMKPYSRI